MKAIEQIIKTAREQESGLTGALCTSEFCSGTCHVCAGRRRALEIALHSVEAGAYIGRLEAVLQQVIKHADCKGEQAPEDCLAQCIADCRAVLDMPNVSNDVSGRSEADER